MPSINRKTVYKPWDRKPQRTNTPYSRPELAAEYNGTRWRRLSKLFLSNSPFCIECEKVGIDKYAKVTDHIKPVTEGGDMWDWNNLQPLCASHHAQKTGRESNNRRNQ